MNDMINDSALNQIGKIKDRCVNYLDQQEEDRRRALEYYNGEMKDMQPERKRSTVVSRDVRATIKKLMPSVMRTILGNDKVVEFDPTSPGDENFYEEVTDYFNNVFIPGEDVETALYDAIFDAVLLKTGILKVVAYEESDAKYTKHEGSADDVIGLLDDDALNHEESDDGHSFERKEVVSRKVPKLEAVPRGSFLIYPDSESIAKSAMVGERLSGSRSSFVEMGYDKEKVWSISASDDREENSDKEARQGDDFAHEDGNDLQFAMQDIIVFEVYVRLDLDKDGIAELYRVVFGKQGAKEGTTKDTYILLDSEHYDEAPYYDVIAERDAHQFEGHSVFEDTEDVQQVKTELTRATLDNLYWQNEMQPVVDESGVEDAESIYNPEFGLPISLKPGRRKEDVIDWHQVPFFADKSFEMLGYMDEVARERTGITDSSGGLDPESFVNMSATAANMVNDSGIAQAEMIVRSLSRGGIRRAFKRLLKLTIEHTEPQEIFRGDEWKTYDPRKWNPEMNCRVNIGLGAGSRERDMLMLQMVKQVQSELLAAFGPDNVFVKPENVYNTLEKLTEVAGFPSAQPYFTKPDPEEVQQKLQAAANQPNPEMLKMQAQQQLEQIKMQANRDKEEAQMQADLTVKQAEMRVMERSEVAQMEATAALEAQKMAFEREKIQLNHAHKLELEREKMAFQVQMEAAKAQFAS